MEAIHAASLDGTLITDSQRSIYLINSGADTFNTVINAFVKNETRNALEKADPFLLDKYSYNPKIGFLETLDGTPQEADIHQSFIDKKSKHTTLVGEHFEQARVERFQDKSRDLHYSSPPRIGNVESIFSAPVTSPSAHAISPDRQNHSPVIEPIDKARATQVIPDGLRETVMPDPAHGQEGQVPTNLPVGDALPRDSLSTYTSTDRESQLPIRDSSGTDGGGTISLDFNAIRGVGHKIPSLLPISPRESSSVRKNPESTPQPSPLRPTQHVVNEKGHLSEAKHARDNPAQISNTAMSIETFVTEEPRQRLAQAGPPPADRSPSARRGTEPVQRVLGTSDQPSPDLIRNSMRGREFFLAGEAILPNQPVGGMAHRLMEKDGMATTPAQSLPLTWPLPGMVENRHQGLEPHVSPLSGRGDRDGTNNDRTGTLQPSMPGTPRFPLGTDATLKIAPSWKPTHASDDSGFSTAPASRFPAPTSATQSEQISGIGPSQSGALADRTREPTLPDDDQRGIINKAATVIPDPDAIPGIGTDAAWVPPDSDIVPTAADPRHQDATAHHEHGRVTGAAVRPAAPEAVSAPPHIPQLAQAISALHTAADGSHHMMLSLRPESLGQVQVRITRSDTEGDQIEIIVARAETLALLRADTTALHQALDAAGLAPTQRDISLQLATPGMMSPDRGMSTFDRPSSGENSQQSFSPHAGHARPGSDASRDSTTDHLTPPPAPIRRRSTGLDITA